MDNIQSSTVENVKKPKDASKIVSFVVDQWKSLQDRRKPQIELAMKLQEWASMNQEPMKIYNTKQEQIDGYKDNKFATIVEVTTAQVGNQSWTNIGQMFDVRSIEAVEPPKEIDFNGDLVAYAKAMQQFEAVMQDEELKKQILEQGEKKAELQKKALEQALYKMKANKQLEKCFRVGDLFWGEKISRLGWKQENIVQKLYGDIENVINYDNADLQAVDPIAFVFDTVKFVKDDDSLFKKIIKIHKRFETIENITSRKYKNNEGELVNLYNLSKVDIQELKNSNKETTETTDPQEDDKKIDEVQVGDSYETLFVHGDFKIDGVEYKNYIAEVFARKYLIRFEPNPIYICPFVIQMDEQDPKTKRGIARLKTIYDSCVMRQNYINMKQQKEFLTGNPPLMMTQKMKEALLKPEDKGVFEFKPGIIIEVDNLSADNASIVKPFTFDTTGDINNVSFITNEISDNGAVNANAMGNVSAGNIKATDLQLAKQGQDIRIQQTLDSIYEFTIKNIEGIAQILALFKSGIEVFKVKTKNVEELIAITDVIRQSQYEYRYEDRNALMNRHAKVEQISNIIERMAQVPEMANRFDWIEIFNMLMEANEFDNPEKCLKSAATVDGVIAEFQRLQPEEQKQIVMMLLQGLQQGQGINTIDSSVIPQNDSSVMDNPVQQGLNENMAEMGA